MSNRSRFAGQYNANDYNYGGNMGNTSPGPLQVSPNSTNATSGSSTITLVLGQTTLSDGTNLAPLATNAPILVGAGTNAESVTPTAVSNPTPSIPYTATVTASFANAHGGDPVASATFGLQEAINAAAAAGGGTVMVDSTWYVSGGTVAIIQAAVVPTNGTVKVFDTENLVTYGNRSSSVSLVSAPATPTSATVASLVGVTGTWTAVTTYVKFVYVTPNGGLTVPSSEYSFTATVSLAIGGPGPAAATGAVGYLVYIGTTTNTDYQVAVSASSGTVIQCGSISCFKIGTPFTSTTITTSATALVPATSNAFTGVQPMPFAAQNMVQPFQTIYPPFANITTVTAGSAQEWARVDLPTAFLNTLGRTLRITLVASFTPGSTATLIPSLLLESLYGTTTTSLWTVTTAATSGTTQSNLWIEFLLTTAAVGATGTIEAHARLTYQSASASPPAALVAIDSVTAASSTADLTKQDTLSFQINSGTANLSSARVRMLIVEILA